MKRALHAAVWPRADLGAARLLRVDPAAGSYADGLMRDLPAFLRPGDLLVANDAATLPASLAGQSRIGRVEVRLAGPPEGDGGPWPAVLFGEGNWRQRTEDRSAPPPIEPGERIVFDGSSGRGPVVPPEGGADPASAHGLSAEVGAVSDLSPRLVFLRFDREGEALWSALYRHGRPVQYSYLCGPLALWHVQTPYGARPLAVEMPSAGAALRWPLLHELRRRGVALAALTHAAGLSSTGDPALDAALPLPERSEISSATVEAVGRARRSGGRVVAVGTTVARALEGRVAEAGALRPGDGVTRLRLGPHHTPRVVDGLLTGLHEPGESHFELLQAFASKPLLEAALAHARRASYLSHEFGDLSLVLAN